MCATSFWHTLDGWPHVWLINSTLLNCKYQFANSYCFSWYDHRITKLRALNDTLTRNRCVYAWPSSLLFANWIGFMTGAFMETFTDALNCVLFVSDHDECMTGNHTCQQRCVNHPGGYSCACQVGFTLNKDNQSCSGEKILIHHLKRLLLKILFYMSQKIDD